MPWNPLDKAANVTLTNANLTATGVASGTSRDNVRGTTSHNTGKWCFELSILAHDTANGAGYGVANAGQSLTAGSSTGTVVITQTSSLYLNGSPVFAPGAPGDTRIMVAVDLDARLWWLSYNAGVNWSGSGIGTGAPATGTLGLNISAVTGALFPFVATYGAAPADSVSLATTGLVGAIPAGFLAWDAPAFTTWNPSDKTAGITLSNANLTATASGAGFLGVRSVHPKINGKFYWEYTFVVTLTNLACGVANAAASLAGGVNGVANAAYVNWAGSVYANSAISQASLGTFSAGGVACVALDLTNRLMWFRNGAAGNWNGSASANPATGAGGITITFLGGGIPAYGLMSCQNANPSGAITANFGATAFTGTVPSGFTAGWDDSVAAVSNVVATQTAVLEFGSAPSDAQLTQAAILEFATPNPDAQVTQLAAEQWYVGVPDVQLTNIFLEQWAQVSSINTQAVLTQMLIEEWTSVADAGTVTSGTFNAAGIGAMLAAGVDVRAAALSAAGLGALAAVGVTVLASRGGPMVILMM